jgi:hypothetical protein
MSIIPKLVALGLAAAIRLAYAFGCLRPTAAARAQIQ